MQASPAAFCSYPGVHAAHRLDTPARASVRSRSFCANIFFTEHKVEAIGLRTATFVKDTILPTQHEVFHHQKAHGHMEHPPPQSKGWWGWKATALLPKCGY